MMKSLAAKLLRFLFRNNLTTSIASNRLVQQGIKQLVKELDYTRGIGAGAGVGTSGERILAELLADLDGNNTFLMLAQMRENSQNSSIRMLIIQRYIYLSLKKNSVNN